MEHVFSKPNGKLLMQNIFVEFEKLNFSWNLNVLISVLKSVKKNTSNEKDLMMILDKAN